MEHWMPHTGLFWRNMGPCEKKPSHSNHGILHAEDTSAHRSKGKPKFLGEHDTLKIPATLDWHGKKKLIYSPTSNPFPDPSPCLHKELGPVSCTQGNRPLESNPSEAGQRLEPTRSKKELPSKHGSFTTYFLLNYSWMWHVRHTANWK